VSDRCWLVNESGKLVDLDTDSKLDFHFDEMLDKVAEWKKQAAQDSSLLGNWVFIFNLFTVLFTTFFSGLYYKVYSVKQSLVYYIVYYFLSSGC